MIYPIESAEKVSAGKTAKEVNVGFRAFLIRNCSESETVYFRDSHADGAACTADNGFPVPPGETLAVPLRAGKLSLIATADAEVRLLYIGEGW